MVGKTKLYCLSTPSHTAFREEWFRPSLRDDVELIAVDLDVDGTCDWLGTGWWAAIDRKIDLFVEATRDNIGRTFLLSDVDIQFFSPVLPTLFDHLGDADLAFQSNTMARPGDRLDIPRRVSQTNQP